MNDNKNNNSSRTNSTTNTLWSQNSKHVRKKLTFKFDARALATLTSSDLKVKAGNEEELYKAVVSKDILSKIVG